MTREEARTALGDRNNLLWGMSKEEQKYYSEALDMAISALSAEGKYIKKSELFDKTIRRNSIWNEVTNSEGKGLEEIVNDLPIYSFPDSADIEKIRAEIQKNLDRCKEFGWEEESRDNVIKAYTEVLEIIDKHIGGKDK